VLQAHVFTLDGGLKMISPLALAVMCGQKDHQLLELIDRMEALNNPRNGGLSVGELHTLYVLYYRLNELTR